MNYKQLLIIMFLIICIYVLYEQIEKHHCDKKGGAVHPECLSPIIRQKFLYGGVYY